MSEPARNRFALDLEDLERQLRGAAQAPRPGQATDPLAELTRIVGQDDPLKDLFAPRPAKAAAPAPSAAAAPVVPAQVTWPESRREPAFSAAPVPAHAPVPAPAPEPAPPAELRGALDEFEALLRREGGSNPQAKAPAAVYVPPAEPAYDDQPAPQPYGRGQPHFAGEAGPRDLDQPAAYQHDQDYGQRQAYAQDGAYAQPAAYAQNTAYAPDPAYAEAYGEEVQNEVPEEDLPVLRPRKSRKGLWTAVGLIAVGVIGVGAAMTFKSPTRSVDGKPPVISADTGPMKVEPANPGGKEIPNQNKQIYERTGQAPQADTKVVSREEQPIDVQQAARSMPARVILPGPGTGTGTSEAGSNPLASAPGTPERLPTPSEPSLTPVPPVPGLGEPRKVRTVSIRPDGTPAGATNGSAGIVTGSNPSSTSAASGSSASQLAPVPRPRPAAVADATKVQERAATPATTATTPAPAATTPAPPLRVASAGPAATTPAPASATPPATQAIRSGNGDFTVQLGAPGSEAEARATFAALQRKYPEVLGGQAPIIRKTDLAGGKTVYRLRIGPYTRENATSMCTSLQSAGGQCFISKN